MRESDVDLFGEVVITHQDVHDWLLAVPRIDPSTRRAAWYVTAYDVPSKIRQAKLSGTFAAIVATKDNGPPAYGAGARLPWLWRPV